LKLARASPSLGARCAQAWRARALPRAILQGAGLMGQTGRADEAPRDVPAYQSGREFDEELIGQLNALPEFFAAFGFANAKTPGFEADDFLAAAVAAEERAGGSVVVASGDRDSFQLASATTTILYPSRGREIARIEPEGLCQTKCWRCLWPW
jgi:5'-3' exonuclease